MEQNFILATYPYDLALIMIDIPIIISVIAFIFADCIAIVHYYKIFNFNTLDQQQM